MKSSLALLFSGLAAQQVSATWNLGAPKFNNPQYNNNQCDDKQKGGFNWGDLPTGGFSGYGDFNFGGGWTCANSFGKRDHLTKRTFGSKCIKNQVEKTKPASFDCKKRKDGFSISEIQVSVEFDCDLEFHYKMPDNSICKHVSPCKKEGSIVKNTQCGGAQSVDVYLGHHNEQKPSCEIGFHSIGFDCNPGYTPSSTKILPTPTSTPASSTVVKTSSVVESSSIVYETSSAVESSSAVYETSSVVVETSSATPYTTPAESTVLPTPESTAPYGNSSIVLSTTPSGPESTPVYSTLVYSTAVESSVVESSVVETPASTTSSPQGSSSVVEVTTGIVYSTGAPPESSTAAPVSSAPPTPYNPPNVLPKCMNTWLELQTECKDNTDINCYCKNADFTKSVIECVKAWATDAETQQALSYLVGICASYVPQNPGLITDCPTNVPLGPTPYPSVVPSGSVPPQTTAAPTQPAQPVTTITYQTTITVPCSSAGSEIPGSSTVSTISTAVTVPQVIFTTAEPTAPGATQSQAINIIPGTPTPAPIPAITTGGYAVPSSIATVVIPTGGNSTATTTGGPAQFTGAAAISSVNMKYTSLFAAALALFAL